MDPSSPSSSGASACRSRRPASRWGACGFALLLLATAAAANDARVTSGLVAYYPLVEGAGETTADRSPVAEPIDLAVTGRASWLSETAGTNGIELDGGRVGHPHPDAVSSPALDVIAALKATGQSTFELWVTPEDLSTSGQPERMLSLGNRMMIGQQNADIQVWLLHTGKNSGANPRLVTTDSPLTASLTHLVHTFDGTTETLYVDGVAHPTTVSASGSFSNWSDNGRLAFGQDTQVQPTDLYKGFSWKGDIRLAAVYDRALSPAEVTTNFNAGPDSPLVWAGPDLATQGLPGQPTQSVTLQGQVPGVGVTAAWSVASSPPGGMVTFGDASAPATTADFSVDGTYVLRLTATEPGFTSTDEVRVDVNVLSTDLPVAVNLSPADAATGVPPDPRLEIVCEADATAARYVVATDDTFTTVVYDSGETGLYLCAQKAVAGLAPVTTYAWSARVRDAQGLWSDWSAPTEFTTANPALLTTVSLRQGEASYTGAADVDIRGYSEDPANPNVVWNQGAQAVLRAGRRVDSTIENYRSLLRFDVSGTGDPGALIDAYLELTASEHGAVSANDFVFEAPHVFYEVLVPWGEGTGITEPPDPGEASWLHSAEPILWSVGGAGGVGTDRAADALMRGVLRNELDHRTAWTSAAFVEVVRGWLADPGSNHGLLLQAENEVAPRTLKLGSKESLLSQRPRLVLEFQDPAHVALAIPGADFETGSGTTIGVEVRYDDGTLVANDSTTQITFTPSGSAAVTAVTTGTGDGGYGSPGGAETVTVDGGVATIVVDDAVVETFTVSFANDAGFDDPPPDTITARGPPTRVALTIPGSDFAAGGSTTVGVEVQDDFGNLVADDDTSQVIFFPGSSASIVDVTTGTGDGGYGTPGGLEVVTVSGGMAAVTLSHTVAETFPVGFANGAGLADPPDDSITVFPGAVSELALSAPGADFAAGGATDVSLALRDAFGNVVTADDTSQLTFTPSGSARIVAVPIGVGDGGYGVPAGAETVTVSGGVASVTLADTVAETFTVSFANDASVPNPAPDAITVSPAAASQVALTTPGSDFAAGASSALAVSVQDGFGNPIASDSSTQVTFTPSGSASVASVTTGTGDGSYGVPAGPETVTVSGGVAAITLTDTAAETFTVGFANGAGLADPAPDEVLVSPAAPSQVVLTTPGSDFLAGESTGLAVAVRDAFGNLVTAATTQITFTPSGGASVAAVTAGTGDGSYGVAAGPETVVVAGGVAAITVADTVAETFSVAFANDGGLADPAQDSILVSPAAPSQVGITAPGADFAAGDTTDLAVAVQDAFGNVIDTDDATQLTFTPSGDAFVSGVTTGVGDADYGVPGGAEGVTVAAGVAAIQLGDTTAETFTVTIASGGALSDPAPDSIEVAPAAPAVLLLSVPGADFTAGEGTSVAVELRDAFDNLVTTDDATQVTFTPSGSAAVSGVLTGAGDGGYGAPGAPESVVVSGGVAAVALSDTVAETFTVTFDNAAAVPGPAPDEIEVTAAAPSQVALTQPGPDFEAGTGTGLTVGIQDAFGNPIAGDDATQVTFTPSGSAAVSGVTTGAGDGSYGVAGGAETVTVSGGLAAIALTSTVAETFTVSFANDAALADAAPDSITVTAAERAQLVLNLPGADFAAGAGTSVGVALLDVYGNVVAWDDVTQVAFQPSDNAAVTAVTTGTGDGAYGAPAFPEVVTVAGGLAVVTVNDTVAEVFSVGLANDAGLSNPPPDSITVTAAGGTDLLLTTPGDDFTAGGSTSLAVEIRDAFGNLATGNSSTQVTFTPSGSARVAGVGVGTGDGSYGTPGGPETVTVSAGAAQITLADPVAETFTVAFANDGGLSDPPPDSITVSAGAPDQLVLTLPGGDFTAGGGTSLEVEVQDASGNRITGDDATQVTFTPSGSARITAVTAGSGDGSYGVAAGAETVTVASGLASIALEDTVAEVFTVGFANDAALASPAADDIQVFPAAASQVVLTVPGSDFDADGGSTSLSVAVRDAFGNTVVSDFGTQVTFTPTSNAFVSDVTTGIGDGAYGTPAAPEAVTVTGGTATIVVADPVIETFKVSFANGAGLANPPDDVIRAKGLLIRDVPALGLPARVALVLLLAGLALVARRRRR